LVTGGDQLLSFGFDSVLFEVGEHRLLRQKLWPSPVPCLLRLR
jgi:hypothetical protein